MGLVVETCGVDDGGLGSNLPLSQLLQAELVAVQQGAGGEDPLLGQVVVLLVDQVVVLQDDANQLVDIIFVLWF